MNCIGTRCMNVKYHAIIKEPYKIEIALGQFDDFIPEVLLNGISVSYCDKQKRANTLYFFSFWVNYSDIYIVQANENTNLLVWEEHRNLENEEHENIYYCSSIEENYNMLIELNFKDINDCFKRLSNRYHIRFHLEEKILYYEDVGSFVLNTKSKRALIQNVDTTDLKELIKDKK